MPDLDKALIEDLEDEASLDSGPPASIKYEKAQRELLTQTVDFSISTLANMLSSGQIDTNPKYQRRNRWDSVRQSRLIESFLMNVPMPPIFLSEEEYGFYAVIDGQQRLRALEDFFGNKLTLSGLEVFNELNGKKRSKIPAELQRILDVRPTMRCIIIQKHSHPEIKFEVFERLNTGGVTLNPQEVRNSAFRGPLNDLILKITESREFRSALRIGDPSRSAMVQHMRDCELVLRFFALKDTWEIWPGGMKFTLNEYMAVNRHMPPSFYESLEGQFMETLRIASDLFRGVLFFRWDPNGQKFREQVVASMYDAQMIACYELNKRGNLNRDDSGVLKVISLFDDIEFYRSVIEATNTPSRLRYRVSRMIEALLR